MPEGRPADQIATDQFVRAFDWLHNLSMSAEYKELKRLRDLLPDRIWIAYKVNGINGLREQVLLEAQAVLVRRAWKKNRPSFFGRVYRGKQDEQSEG